MENKGDEGFERVHFRRMEGSIERHKGGGGEKERVMDEEQRDEI